MCKSASCSFSFDCSSSSRNALPIATRNGYNSPLGRMELQNFVGEPRRGPVGIAWPLYPENAAVSPVSELAVYFYHYTSLYGASSHVAAPFLPLRDDIINTIYRFKQAWWHLHWKMAVSLHVPLLATNLVLMVFILVVAFIDSFNVASCAGLYAFSFCQWTRLQ